ncbi:cation-transporting P-type ATPase [Streptomyces sp. MAR4 CNY-716]
MSRHLGPGVSRRTAEGHTGAGPPAPGGSAPPGAGPEVPQLDAGKVFAVLDTSRRGLSEAQARARLEESGANQLPRARRRAGWRRLVAQFTDLFAVVLIMRAGLGGAERPWSQPCAAVSGGAR